MIKELPKKNMNFIAIMFLGVIYIPTLYFCGISFITEGFRGIAEINWVEIASLLIFLVAIVLALKHIKCYAVILLFAILGMPASVDNWLPSVLISSSTDYKDVYFPLITHIDLFLILGLFKFWKPLQKQSMILGTRMYKLLLLGTLLMIFAVISLNITFDFNYYNIGLIISHSYHFRYVVLLLLLFYNTEINSQRKYLLYGIVVSVIFLLIESSVFTLFVSKSSRLISGSLKVNTFANILSAISCYFTYILIRKKLSTKYIALLVLLVLSVFMTKTRSAIFIYLTYIIIESIYLLLRNKRMNFAVKIGIISVVTVIIFIFSSGENKRYSFTDLGLKKINFNKTQLAEIIELEKNEFNESLILRLHHFQTSLNMIKKSPFIGIGPGKWNAYKSDYGSKNREIMDSHNDVLAFTSQYGVILGIMFLFCIYLIPYLNFRKMKLTNSRKDDVLSYLFIINIVMIFAGLSNTGLFKHQVFGFLAAIAILSFYNNESISIE